MNFTALDKTIRKIMRGKNTPGLALSLVHDGKLVYAKGFGSRNLKAYSPMDENTLIGIGSITKSFTAFAILKLQEAGKLNIEDSAADYLDYGLFTERPEIKIKHMLSHSTGIPSMDAGGKHFAYTFSDLSCIYPVETREQFITHLSDAAEFIVHSPGEHFFYNNDMYSCLAFIIEDLSGISFEQFLQQEILQPLEMSRAVLTQQALDSDPDQNVMTGYRFESRDDGVHAMASDVPIGGNVQAPGGIYTSMTEMANYALCLLNNGEFKGQQLLSPASVALLFTPQMSTPYGRGADPQYCLGWSKDDKTEQMPHTVIHHGGCMLTSSSHLMLIPELNLSVAVAENSATGVCGMVADAVVATLLEQDPAAVIEDLKIINTVDEILGTYRSPHELYQLTLSRKNSMLWVDAQIDDGAVSFAMVSHDIDKLEFARYSLRADNKNKITLIRNQASGRIEYCTYDRYLYRRV